jgi:hypothetical protein
MMKIMQMEVLNVAVLTRSKRPVVKISNGICLRDPRVSHVVARSHDSLTGCIPGDEVFMSRMRIWR